MRKLLTAGIFGTILGIVSTGTANASIVSSGFLDEKLTEYALSTSLDLKANQTDLTALSNKIGTLPSAILPSMWTDIPYYTEYGVNMPDAGFTLPTTIGEQLEFLLNGGPESPIDRMFRVITALGGNVNANDDPSADFLGLNPLTQKVRSIEENITLSSGVQIQPSKGLAFLLPEPPNSTYPTSIKDFMFDIYTGYWSVSFLAEAVYFGNEHMGQKDPALVVKGLRQITDEIGTLPSGGFTVRPELTELLIWAEQENTYPTSLSELITALYGNPETGKPGLLFGIVGGFRTSFGEDIGFGAAKALANKAQATADANTAKIGDLPTEYATVGAALTAIKGIAEDAKAAALAAIPDPKQEGSSGKFVLTVDIVGDNATYHWEKIDREGETTTTE